MVTNLYVFVDECGLPNEDEYFSVAGCWCISEHGPAPTLNETRVSMRNLMAGMGEVAADETEIKGRNLSPQGLDALFASFNQFANQDNTLSNPPYPWGPDSKPVRFTYGEVDANVGRAAFREFGHDLDTPQMVQTMMLLTVLRPLLYESPLDSTRYDRVRVVLDAETWRPAKEAIEDTDRVEDFEFIIEDSTKAPGIQLADVAARIRRMHRLGRDYNRAVSKLDELRLE